MARFPVIISHKNIAIHLMYHAVYFISRYNRAVFHPYNILEYTKIYFYMGVCALLM